MNKLKAKILSVVEKLALRLNKNSEWVLRQIRIYQYFEEFEEREDDVYVITYLKAGTTWVQMILYQMLFKAGDNFEHIYDVSPWPSNEAYLGESAKKANGLPSPRILKTHNPYDHFNKNVKGRFIYVYRDGMDLAASVYHHEKNYLDPNQTFEESFKKHFQNESENWFLFNRDWMQNQNGFAILYISYEQLKNEFEATIKKIAAFLRVEVTPEEMVLIKHFSGFSYMKTIEHKFGEKPTKESQLVFNQFIRKGETGTGKEYLSEEQKQFYIANHEHIIGKLFREKIQKWIF